MLAKTWNPKESDSGLSREEQEKYSAWIDEEYKRGNKTYINAKMKEQQSFTKVCISENCRAIFNVPDREYYLTECPQCRHKLGKITNKPLPYASQWPEEMR